MFIAKAKLLKIKKHESNFYICFFCFQVLFGRIDAFNTLARLRIDILWLFFIFFFLCFYDFQMKSSRRFPKGTLKCSSHGQIYIWFLFSVLQLVYIMKNVDWKIVPLLSKIDFTKDILQGIIRKRILRLI